MKASNVVNLIMNEKIVFVSGVLTLTIIGLLFWVSGYGYDLTDESYYLIWMKNPYSYKFSVSQFGFIYYPFYYLFDEDIASLRRMNVALIFGLAWFNCHLLLRRIKLQVDVPLYSLSVISAALATSSLVTLVFAGRWLPTPSYNSLTFTGLLVATAGLLFLDTNISRRVSIGWCVVGLGGWLTFMGKPTTAIAVGCLVLAYVSIVGKFSLRFLLAPVCFSCLLLFSAYLIDGSIMEFVNRNRGGLELGNILFQQSVAKNLVRFDSLPIQDASRYSFWVITVVTFMAGFFSLTAPRRMESYVILGQVLIIICGISAVICLHTFQVNTDSFQNLVLFAVMLGCTLIVLAEMKRGRYQLILSSQVALAIFFLCITYAYALGTNNNYWIQIGGASIFAVIAGIVLLLHLSSKRMFLRLLLSVSIVVQVVTALLLVQGLQFPYRQPNPLLENDYVVEVGRSGGRLILAESMGKYMKHAKEIATKAGFSDGTAMIDMTGHSPGLLHFLGANSIGMPWSLGGHSGSLQFMELSMQTVSCELLATSWVLTEPGGMFEIPEIALASFGANVDSDFEIAATFMSPDGRLQQIHKPLRIEKIAEDTCNDFRKKKT